MPSVHEANIAFEMSELKRRREAHAAARESRIIRALLGKADR